MVKTWPKRTYHAPIQPNHAFIPEQKSEQKWHKIKHIMFSNTIHCNWSPNLNKSKLGFEKRHKVSPLWVGTTWALAPQDLIALNSTSITASRVSHSLSFLSCSASMADSAAEGWARLLGVWRALVRGPLWRGGGWSGEALSRGGGTGGIEGVRHPLVGSSVAARGCGL